MKSYTDLEQSKKLAEILPLESADMYWWSTSLRYYIEAMDDGDFVENRDIRAWSLAALMDVLPDEVGDNHYLTLDKEGKEYCCCYEDNNGNSFRHCFSDNPIDACYEMIIKLKDLNLL